MSNQNKLWIILFAFGRDFVLFFIINVAFLVGIKGLTYSEFFSLSAIAGFVSLLSFFPIYFLMSKLKNKTMIIIAQILRVASMTIFILADQYVLFILANCLYYLSFQFNSVFTSLLKANLKDVGKEDMFIPVYSKGLTVKAVVDILAVAASGVMFTINPRLAMVISLGFCIVSLIASFFIKNPKSVEKIVVKQTIAELKTERAKAKQNKVVWEFVWLVIGFVICLYGAFNLTISYVKTSLQELEISVLIMCAVIGIEKIARLIGYLFIPKLKNKHHYSSNITSIVGLAISVVLILLPMFIFENLTIKIIITSLGALILGLSASLYMLSFQNFMNKFVDLKKQRRAAFVVATASLTGIVLANSLLVFVCNKMELKIASLVIFGIIAVAFILYLLIIYIIKTKNIKPIYKYVREKNRESTNETKIEKQKA